MKQIERKNSPQRLICELLQHTPEMTIADISAARQVHARAVARQLDSLVAEGFVMASGYPRRYQRTQKPLPDVVPRTPRSELETSRRRPARKAPHRTVISPAFGDLERVVSCWVGS